MDAFGDSYYEDCAPEDMAAVLGSMSAGEGGQRRGAVPRPG